MQKFWCKTGVRIPPILPTTIRPPIETVEIILLFGIKGNNWI